jgi:hypothetical protein
MSPCAVVPWGAVMSVERGRFLPMQSSAAISLTLLTWLAVVRTPPIEAFEPSVDLEIPSLGQGEPAAGKRVAVVAPEYEGSSVHHLLYLPPDWDPNWKKQGRSWPVIVEYTGNHFPKSGSTGEVEGAALGYGLGGGQCIWVVLPFISDDRKRNEVTWWGDERATVEYAKRNVPRICAQFGGDTNKVVICGFSRGAIAVNYIGLYDDQIASLWCGFMCHDHYDGVRQWPGTQWGYPESEYRKAAAIRRKRLVMRPVLVCQAEEEGGVDATKQLIGGDSEKLGFTFLAIPIKKIFPAVPNALVLTCHTDRWMLVDSTERQQARIWLQKTLYPPSESGKAD